MEHLFNPRFNHRSQVLTSHLNLFTAERLHREDKAGINLIRPAITVLQLHPLGYLKRLEVARALALEPALLLLDEPLAGLNSAEAETLADTVVALNRRGVTVVMIEHNLGEVMRVCQHLVVLDNGRKIGDGAPDEVMADPTVRAAYLGARHATTGGGDAAA